jgi:spore coat protein U-like protein
MTNSTKLSCALVILLLAVGPAKLFAGSASASLSVTATVANDCTVSTSALAFGSYEPIATNASTPMDGTGSVTITCTRGATTTIGLDAGSNAPGSGTTRAMLAGGVKLDYEIYKDSGRTTIWGNSGASLFTPPVAPNKNSRSFSVFGRIPAGQDVASGSYNDSVLATINF